MLKKNFRISFVALGFLAITACSPKAEFTSLFPLGEASGECAAGYNPIGIEAPGAAPVDLSTIDSSGNFSHVSTEFFYEISDAGAVKTQVHAKEIAGGNPEWICSNHQAGAYPSGTDLLVALTLPTTATPTMTERGRYQIQASDSFLAMSGGTAAPSTTKLSSVLSSMPATEYRAYALANNRFEIRIISTETLEGRYAVKKNAIVRLQYAPALSTASVSR